MRRRRQVETAPTLNTTCTINVTVTCDPPSDSSSVLVVRFLDSILYKGDADNVIAFLQPLNRTVAAVNPTTLFFEGRLLEEDLRLVFSSVIWNSVETVTIRGLALPFFTLNMLNPLTEIRMVELSNNRLIELKHSDESHTEAFLHAGQLTQLDLSQNSLTRLQSDIFKGMTSLQTLFLQDNQLTEVPADVFQQTPKLGNLILRNNHIQEVNADAFVALSNLWQLSLRINDISQIPKNAFRTLGNLEFLFLDRNPLRSIESGLFDSLTRLETLDVGGTRIETLPPGIFNHTTALRDLRLFENQLNTLTNDAFRQLRHLEALFLSENRLTQLPEDLFKGLVHLRNLFLDDNVLEDLPEGIFSGLPSLFQLTLGGNQLSCLCENIFQANTNLRTLDLGNNQLTYVPPGLFVPTRQLGTLILGDNQLASFSVSETLPFLQALWLNRNQIKQLPDFSKMPSLREIHLNDHLLSEVDLSAFFQLQNLEVLSLLLPMSKMLGWYRLTFNLILLPLPSTPLTFATWLSQRVGRVLVFIAISA
eukprot:m.249571 g.249571  ORF g.249571 m.249571 type:complete len:534 (-) comp17167_c0_seq1:2649-4250(-)